MPYYDEEHPGQPLWQSVLLFCCKGMIEGIMVVLFFWLLVLVLFTKQLEGHLQVLLSVGLVVFCLCLMLGCVLCWRSSQIPPFQDKEHVTSAPAPEELATRVQAQTTPLAAPAVVRQQYEELDGDILEYPSTFSSPTPSEDKLVPIYSPSPFGRSAAGHKEHTKSYFSLRRLSTPPIASPLYQSMDHSRASLSSLPKLGLLSKTCRVLERRCTVTGDSISYSERQRLTGPGVASPSVPEEPIPLAPLYYGSGSSSRKPGSLNPWIHFTMAFSPEHRTLTVTVISLRGTSYRLEDVSALASLVPYCPRPVKASGQCSLNSESQRLVIVLNVSSVEELSCCVLRVSLYTHHRPRSEGSLLGELEVQCGSKDWSAEHPIHFTKELNPKKGALRMSLNSLEEPLSKGLSRPPQILAQLFILLQYQTLAHRIKAIVLGADQLNSLTDFSAAPEYKVVINLHHEGMVICTRETRVWNTPFLFDLPPGDISQMHIMLEFIVMQNQSTVLGRVLIGRKATEAGREHWREMCTEGPVERALWHTVQPEPL